jgi:Protein of unknown function (DUF3352)
MKRAFRLVLVAMVLGVLGLAPARHTTAATTPSLASLMPADTFSFVEIRTDDPANRLAAIEGFLRSANIPSDMLTSFDRALTQALGRPASFAKDIAPWLGNHVASGTYIPDTAIDSLFTRRPFTGTSFEAYFLLEVKDDAAADAFLKDVMASTNKSGAKLTPKPDQIGDSPATLYLDDKGAPTLARWKGYLAVGGPSVAHLVDTLKNKKPTLDADPNYRTVIGMLKPDNAVTMYLKAPITPPAYVVVLALLGPSIGNIFQNIVRNLTTPVANPTATPSPTPSPTPVPEVFELASLFRNLGASGLGFYGDAKTASIDFAFHINPDNLQKTFTLLKVPATVQLATPAKSISLQMADRISNKAVFVMIGSDLAQTVRNGLTLAQAGGKLIDLISGSQSSASSSVDAIYGQLQLNLKQLFDLDLNQDVLSWLGGDYALYTLRGPTGIQPGPGGLPFEQVLLVDSTDAAKTQNFLDKLNAGLGKLSGTAPVQGSTGLFSFQTGASSPGINYGLIKNTFVVGTSGGSTDAASAARGDGTLAQDAQWKAAIASLPKSYQNVWYVDMTRLGSWLNDATAQSRSPSDKQTAALVNLFQSAVLYSTDFGSGNSLTTITLFLK